MRNEIKKGSAKCVFVSHDEKTCDLIAGKVVYVTLHMTSTASLETAQIKRIHAYDERQYLDNDKTCEIAKQKESVSGAVAVYDELRAHVLGGTRIGGSQMAS